MTPPDTDVPELRWDGDDTVEIQAEVENSDDLMSVFYDQLGGAIAEAAGGADTTGSIDQPVQIEGTLILSTTGGGT